MNNFAQMLFGRTILTKIYYFGLTKYSFPQKEEEEEKKKEFRVVVCDPEAFA